TAAITAERLEDVDFLAIFENFIAELPELQYVVTVGEEDLWYDDRIFQFEDLVSSGTGRSYPAPVSLNDDSDLALIYTSGTMGKPKGVRISHRSLVESAVRSAEAVEMEPADRVLCAVPLFSVVGVGMALGTMASGASLVMQERFDPGSALRPIESERLTVIQGVPTMYHMLMREPDFQPERLTHIRTGVVAGGPVSPSLVRRIRRWCYVQVAYGLTECSTVSMTRFTDAEDKRIGTVG